MTDTPSLAQDCPLMATPSLTAARPTSAHGGRPALDKKPGPFTYVVFFAVLEQVEKLAMPWRRIER